MDMVMGKILVVLTDGAELDVSSLSPVTVLQVSLFFTIRESDSSVMPK